VGLPPVAKATHINAAATAGTGFIGNGLAVNLFIPLVVIDPRRVRLQNISKLTPGNLGPFYTPGPVRSAGP
jgi:hypothetical protein